MRSSAKEVFNYIKINFDKPISPIDQLIEQAIEEISEVTLSEIQLAEQCETIKGRVITLLEEYIEAFKTDGTYPDLQLGEGKRTLIKNNIEIRKAGSDFARWLSEVNPIKFERLCKKILELEGCTNVSVTSPSGDGGIDFFGIKQVPFEDEDGPNIFRNIQIVVIGQAKRYNRDIGIAELREFIGSYSLIKFAHLKNSPRCMKNPLNANFYRPLAPVLLTFITSSNANKTVLNTANWLGIRLIGGSQLLEILSRNRFGFRVAETGIEFYPSDLNVL